MRNLPRPSRGVIGILIIKINLKCYYVNIYLYKYINIYVYVYVCIFKIKYKFEYNKKNHINIKN